MKDIWTFPVNSKRNTICYTDEAMRHPAKMELNMCRKIIKLYSKPGDLVLDPMAGIGSTIVEGIILNRNVIGVEYEEKFSKISEQNIKKVNKSMHFMNKLGKGQVINGDSRELSKLVKGKVDWILCSSPYGCAISKNIGTMNGKTYLSEMMKIYSECFKVLKEEGYMVLVTKNYVRAGKQIRLDSDTIKLCEAAGFKYIRKHYRLIKNPSFWITNAIQKWEKKHPGEKHPYPLVEDILVFQKCHAELKLNPLPFDGRIDSAPSGSKR